MITDRQRSMIESFDREANENKVAGVLAMALRLKVCRACESCFGTGIEGGEGACRPCLAAGIIYVDGCIVGSKKRAPEFAADRAARTPPADGFPWGPWSPGGPWSADADGAEPRRTITVDVTVARSAWGDPNMTERYDRYKRITHLAAAAPKLLSSLEAVLAIWLRDAADGDGILETDAPALAAARDALVAAKGGAA